MAINKRPEDGKWILNVKPGGRSGKQIKKVFETQREAKNYEIWLRSQVNRNPEWQPEKPERRKLGDLISTWWEAHGKNLRSGEDTKNRLINLSERLDNPLAIDFNALKFSEYRSERLDEEISAATMNRELAYIKSMFSVLGNIGEWKRANPMIGIKKIKEQQAELAFLSQSEIEVLLKTLKESENPHVYLITKICLSTGCRWSEAENLNISAINKEKIIFQGRTKNFKSRTVPISKALESEIRKHREKFPNENKIFGSGGYDAFRWCVENKLKMNLPDGQLTHILRHTFASHFMMSGGDILVLQRILDHKSVNVTMKYSHFSPDHLNQAVQFNPLSKL